LGNNFTLTAGGTITLTGPVQGLNSVTLATTNNASIVLQKNVIAPTINITANGSGSISQTNGLLYGGAVNLTSGSGDIGLSNGTSIAPISAVDNPISFTTSGNVRLINQTFLAPFNASLITTTGTQATGGSVTLGSWSGTSLTFFQAGGDVRVNGQLSSTSD